jgi:hypothetical protein
VNPAKRRVEFLQHVAERKDKGSPPPDQYIIMAQPQTIGPDCIHRRICRQSHHLPQSPANAVALHGIAHLSRHGETDTHCPFVAAPTRLQNKGARRCPRTAGSSTKIAPPSQPLQGGDGTGVPITH